MIQEIEQNFLEKLDRIHYLVHNENIDAGSLLEMSDDRKVFRLIKDLKLSAALFGLDLFSKDLNIALNLFTVKDEKIVINKVKIVQLENLLENSRSTLKEDLIRIYVNTNK